MCDKNRKRPASDTCLERFMSLALVRQLVVVVAMCRLLSFRLSIVVSLLFADQKCCRICCIRDILEAFAFISSEISSQQDKTLSQAFFYHCVTRAICTLFRKHFFKFNFSLLFMFTFSSRNQS